MLTRTIKCLFSLYICSNDTCKLKHNFSAHICGFGCITACVYICYSGIYIYILYTLQSFHAYMVSRSYIYYIRDMRCILTKDQRIPATHKHQSRYFVFISSRAHKLHIFRAHKIFSLEWLMWKVYVVLVPGYARTRTGIMNAEHAVVVIVVYDGTVVARRLCSGRRNTYTYTHTQTDSYKPLNYL